MVRDLNFDLEIVVGQIVREPDGLAMSSRNRYLSSQERRKALVLSRALAAAAQVYQGGERSTGAIETAAKQVMAEEAGVRLDYVSLVDPATLLPLSEACPGALLAVAAWIGTTRLIDNQLL